MTERSWSKIRIWLLLQIVKLTDLCPDHLSLQTQEQSLHGQRATNITSGTLCFHLKFLPAFVNINLLYWLFTESYSYYEGEHAITNLSPFIHPPRVICIKILNSRVAEILLISWILIILQDK